MLYLRFEGDDRSKKVRGNILGFITFGEIAREESYKSLFFEDIF